MSNEDFHTDERLKERNTTLLAEFTNHLIIQGKIGKRKAHDHAGHLEFFGNEYLRTYHSVDLLAGHIFIGSFLGDWFIRKAMWSDEAAIEANVVSFRLFYDTMQELGNLKSGHYARIQEILIEGEPEWIRLAQRYNDAAVEFEDVWDDDLEKDGGSDTGEEPGPDLPAIGDPAGTLRLNLLLSTKVAKFLGVKPGELQKTSGFGNDGYHWSAYWRCEECFLYNDSEDRGILVTNLLTRYSFLINGAPGDRDSLVRGLLGPLMRDYEKQNVAIPSSLSVEVVYCSGSSRSLCGTQNNWISMAHAYSDDGIGSTEDLERRLNGTPTKTTSEIFPDLSFAKMLKEDPPFVVPDSGPRNIIPFLN